MSNPTGFFRRHRAAIIVGVAIGLALAAAGAMRAYEMRAFFWQ
jgi:hypothetical protein